MKFLFVAKQKKNVDAFGGAIGALLDAGHHVTLAIEDRDADRDGRLREMFTASGFALQTSPVSRSDEWRTHARLIRRFRDWIQYLGPQYAGADKLRLRVLEKLHTDLEASGIQLDGVLSPDAQLPLTDNLANLLAHLESSIPSDPLYEEFITRDRPDVVLVTPGVHFGSAQADFIKSARAAGLPVWMLLFSWDNLSTKGALHEFPDLMFVWNERQRREAAELHQFPADRVVIVGAPRFDDFFTLRPTLSRTDFLAPLGLNPDRPTLLYVCSSRFVAQHELQFVRRWLAALRASPRRDISNCNVIIRPHPDIALLDNADAEEMVTWPGLRNAAGYVSRPFDDPQAIVLRTSNKTPQPFYECIYHSAAVVGLNTSAALEAGIVGRPVFTVLADDESVTGQSNTLHFHYLLQDNGGFVRLAADLATHIAQVSTALSGEADELRIKQFVADFLRPCGDRPVSQVLAQALMERAESAARDGGVRLKPDTTEHRKVRLEPDATEHREESAGDTKPTKTLRVAYPASSLRVWSTPETRKTRRHGELFLEEGVTHWLDRHVRPGDVVYDIGAGIGTYALVAAIHRGALAVAFEPAFATYKRLCDNILLNNCRRSIVPLPLALGAQAGLFELEYREESPGEGHTVKERPWRAGPDDRPGGYIQPVCVEPLDHVVPRHRLPRPNHMRVASARAAAAILRGAANVIRRPAMKSLLVTVSKTESGDALSKTARGAGLDLSSTIPREDGVTLLFVRDPARERRRWWG